MRSENDRPTTIRVQRSMTAAMYSQPSPVRRYVMSPTSFTVGTGLSKSRRMRSGRAGASGSGTVVRLEVRGCTPRIPSSRMSLRTR